jgi:hypothetical protein
MSAMTRPLIATPVGRLALSEQRYTLRRAWLEHVPHDYAHVPPALRVSITLRGFMLWQIFGRTIVWQKKKRVAPALLDHDKLAKRGQVYVTPPVIISSKNLSRSASLLISDRHGPLARK